MPTRLPALREDLQLHPSAPHADGSPAWTIQDPVNNQFYRIGWLEFELLSRWSLAEPKILLDTTAKDTLLTPTMEELDALYTFLLDSQLLVIHTPQHNQDRFKRFEANRANRLKWLLHHYLFFRIPLIHPEKALQRAMPWLSWLFSPATALAVIALTLIGLVLTARQWDVFVASFMDTLSPGGLAAYLVALAVTKSLHELGHALTATRHGVRVAHMGIAFVVLWPMLYTDTGESWRLSDSRQRLQIASAGILTEMALAGLATLAWHLTSDGDMKQALFFLASTAWIMTLALNISPFMRFDGYFIVSDLLDMPNLHERSFALARCALRNTLLGWNEAYPEPLATRSRRLLITFAIATWLYRLTLFVGIAVAVYVYFFKLLGILLFAVEIAWFVVMPIWRELRLWHARRSEISAYRKRSALVVSSVLLLILAMPWGYQIPAKGLAHAAQVYTFYSPLPARLLARPVTSGLVEPGQTIFVLEQPELAFRGQIAQAAADALERQLQGLAAMPDGEERRSTLAQLQAMHAAQAQAQVDEASRLILTAPFAGLLTDLATDVTDGTWIGTRQPLAILVSPDRWQADVWVNQDDLHRVTQDAVVRFYPEGETLHPLKGRVVDVDRVRTQQLPHPLLSSQHGGNVAVLPDQLGMKPRDALYRVRVRLDNAPAKLNELRGSAIIEGTPESWLFRVLKPALIVIIRELSF